LQPWCDPLFETQSATDWFYNTCWCDPLFFAEPSILSKPGWLNGSKGREFNLGFRNLFSDLLNGSGLRPTVIRRKILDENLYVQRSWLFDVHATHAPLYDHGFSMCTRLTPLYVWIRLLRHLKPTGHATNLVLCMCWRCRPRHRAGLYKLHTLYSLHLNKHIHLSSGNFVCAHSSCSRGDFVRQSAPGLVPVRRLMTCAPVDICYFSIRERCCDAIVIFLLVCHLWTLYGLVSQTNLKMHLGQKGWS